jgi:hypothetical protein
MVDDRIVVLCKSWRSILKRYNFSDGHVWEITGSVRNADLSALLLDENIPEWIRLASERVADKCAHDEPGDDA